MKKNKIFKILSVLILTTILSCGSIAVTAKSKEPVKKERKVNDEIKEVEKNVKEHEKINAARVKKNVKFFKNISNYKKYFGVKQFVLKVYEKGGIPILHYIHKKTKANVIIIPVREEKDLRMCMDYLFFKARDNSDKGLVHFCEHLVSGGEYNDLMAKFPDYLVNASTGEIGFLFTTQSDFPEYRRYLEVVSKNLRAFNDDLPDEKIFEKEKKRIFYELKDIEGGPSGDYQRMVNFGQAISSRQYYIGGNSDKVNKIGREEVGKFFKKCMHPSNLCAIRHTILNKKNVKDYLKNLDELYLKHFKYKKCAPIKYKLKDEKPFKKTKWPYDASIFKEVKNRGKKPKKLYTNVAYASYFFDDPKDKELKDLLSLSIYADPEKGKLFKKLKRYIKSLGYDEFKIVKGAVQGSCFSIKLYSNKGGKLFEEKTLKNNFNKILKFLKKQLKNMSDLELTQVLTTINDYTEKVLREDDGKSDDINVSLSYLNSCRIEEFFIASFALDDDPFCKKYFNIDKNNKIIETRKSVIEAVKNNLDIYDKLSKKGPKYIDHLFADKNLRYTEKFKLNYAPYFLPIKFKNYKNNKALYFIASEFMAKYLTDCLGLNNSLTHGIFDSGKYNKGPVSMVGSCKESKKAVFDYLKKNFNDVINKYNITKKQFEGLKKDMIKRYAENLAGIKRGIKDIEKFKKDVDMYIKGENNPKSKINNDLNVGEFIRLHRSYMPDTDGIFLFQIIFCDSDKEFTNSIETDIKNHKTFHDKHPQEKKINKDVVKDYVSLVVDVEYDNLKKNLKFYKQLVNDIGSIKRKDVADVIKSSYLLKGDEFKEVEKVNDFWFKKQKEEREDALKE